MVLLILLGLGLYAHAGEAPVKVRVSDRTIVIPAPSGFSEIGEGNRDLVPASPNNRLLAIFVPSKDLPAVASGTPTDIESYMQVQVPRQGEDRSIGATEFKKLTTEIRQKQDKGWEEVRGEINKKLSDAAWESKDFPQLEVGKPIPLGTFLDKENAYGFAMLMTLNEPGRPKPITMVCDGCFLRVKDRLLFAYIYKKYDGKKSIDAVHRTSQVWVDQILGANK